MVSSQSEILAGLYLNAVFPRMEELCRYDDWSRDLLKTSGGFRAEIAVWQGVSNSAELSGSETLSGDLSRVKLLLWSNQQLNALFSGNGFAVPIPLRGVFHPRKLQTFSKLAKRLEAILNPPQPFEGAANELEIHVRLSLHLAAMAAVEVSRAHQAGVETAGRLPDGVAQFSVDGTDMAVWIESAGGKLKAGTGSAPKTPDAELVVDNLLTARDLLGDRLDQMAAIGLGKIEIWGRLDLLDGLGVLMETASGFLR